MTTAVDILVERLAGRTPKVALVLGSGLGGSAASAVAAVVAEYGEQRKLAIEARDHLTAAFEALWSEMEEEYLSEK